MEKIKMIKKDAIISITVGTSFISDLQGILLSLLADKKEEDIASLKDYIPSVEKGEEEFPEDWMKHIYTITLLLKEIENNAEKNNQIIEVDLNEQLSSTEVES
jgi:hypothetical protein